jgi:hypothetical protein
MANTYLDSVLAEDHWLQASATTPSKRSFVAIGSQMWTIWKIVLQFKHGVHVEPSVTIVVQALADLIFGSSGEVSSSIGEVPNYPTKISCEWEIPTLTQV